MRGGKKPSSISRRLFVLRIMAGALAMLPLVLLLSGYIQKNLSFSLMLVEAKEGICIPHRLVLVHKKDPGKIERGEILAFRPKQGKMKVFEEVKGLKDFVVAKYVGGIKGDVLEVKNDTVSVAGKDYGGLDLIETLKLEPGTFDRKIVVGENQYAMMGTEERSYDARYWGLIDESEIIGRAYPVW